MDRAEEAVGGMDTDVARAAVAGRAADPAEGAGGGPDEALSGG